MDKEISVWQLDDEIISILAARIQERRLQLNLSQVDLAKETGLSKATVQKIENGNNLRLETLVRILRFFGELDKLDQILKPQNISLQELYKMRTKKPRLRARKSHD